MRMSLLFGVLAPALSFAQAHKVDLKAEGAPDPRPDRQSPADQNH